MKSVLLRYEPLNKSGGRDKKTTGSYLETWWDDLKGVVREKVWRPCQVLDTCNSFVADNEQLVIHCVLWISDVDTPEPDEKSLITYISSLYDVFPDPPAIHPLYDPVSIKLEAKLCRISYRKLMVKYDRTWFPTSIRLETKSSRIS